MAGAVADPWREAKIGAGTRYRWCLWRHYGTLIGTLVLGAAEAVTVTAPWQKKGSHRRCAVQRRLSGITPHSHEGTRQPYPQPSK